MTRLVAHRGAHDEHSGVRENTLAAIRAALASGTGAIEVDVRLTADGEVVLLHDATLRRLWQDPREIAAVTLAELGELSSSRHRIPLLSEALAEVHGTGVTLLIDMDDAAPAAPAAAIASASGVPVAWCGDLDAMLLIRSLLPDAEIWLPWNDPVPPTAADLAGLRPSMVNSRHLVVGGAFVEAVHALGCEVSCWTVDDPAQAARLAALGVDSITTNRIDEVRSGLLALDEPARRRAIVAELARDAADLTVRARRDGIGEVSTKTGPADHVTEVDRGIERWVRAVVGAQFPEHDMVGEEYGGTSSGDRACWYLDPVDGTANLANGVPWTSFSLALVVDGEPVVGAVIDPVGSVPVIAAAGEGSWRDGERLMVRPSSGEDPLAGAIVVTELAGARPWPGFTGLLERLAARHCTLRVPGSGTATLAGIAMGRGAAAIVHRYSRIDHAAALLTVAEAGGIVLDREGRETLDPGDDIVIVAADRRTALALHAEWRAALPEGVR